MTNYNERLDEVLDFIENYGVSASTEGFDKTTSRAKAKQAFTSLIKELVAEAKPQEHIDVYTYSNAKTNDDIRKIAINQFEQNLLKALSNNGKAE